MTQRQSFFRAVFAAGLILASLVNAACGTLEGTYSNLGGNVMLELRSGGKADLTSSGEVEHCTWKSDSSKVTVTCKGDSVDFARHDDGSLTGPSFVGVLKKSKS